VENVEPSDGDKKDVEDPLASFTKEQKKELSMYMDRIKAEYLQKILEQVNI